MEISEVLREALGVVLRISGPILLLGLTVGICVAIFQAVTSIHEQSLAFILKLIVVVGTLVIAGGWMMELLLDFCRQLFELM